MSLSLCMIVKNEEDHLKRCLESVKDIVDEMIVVDTGSEDGTVAIAESLGAKVYYFPWNGSFSDARNYSLKQAGGDWIMLMDADEELEKCEPSEIRDLMNDPDADAYFFETVSYVGDEPGCDIVKSMNVRLLKNKAEHFFYHPIHEQICASVIAANPAAKFINKSIKVYHYGYLNACIHKKNKRTRNIEIIEKALDKNPEYAFNLYNLGSEYCAMEEYQKALELFEQACRNFNPQEGFGPVMLFKMAFCCLEIGKYEEALKLCDAGLAYYPQFTDLAYMKGVILSETGLNELAVQHFKRCLDMGEAPNHLNVVAGTGSYRPLFALGEIYLEGGDYEAAVESFIFSFLENPEYLDALGALLKTYCRMYAGDAELIYNIEKLRDRMPAGYDGEIIGFLTNEKRYGAAHACSVKHKVY